MIRRRPPPRRERPLVVHLTTTDMSLDWLLRPQLLAFREAGFDVMGMSAHGTHVAGLEAAGIHHIAVASLTRAPGITADARAFRELYRLLRTLRPDILHTHNPKPGVLGRVAGRLAGVPVVVNTQHGLYAQPTDRLRRRLPVYVVERLAAACSDAELVQNPEDARTLVHTLRVPAARVTVLGNGIDLQRFHGDRSARDRVRGGWGITEDDVVAGVVGRLVREKGLDELFAAAHTLRRQGARARMVVVGPMEPDKPDGATAAAIAAAESDGVVFAGRRDDMPDCYAAFDLFVTASHREGFPRAAMEAAASGLPVVATDIRGCRQAVDDGVTGRLVPVRDPAALATAIAELAADPVARAALGAAGAAKAAVDFDQTRVIAITLATYRRLTSHTT